MTAAVISSSADLPRGTISRRFFFISGTGFPTRLDDRTVRQRRSKPKPWWRLFFENGERLVREYRKIVGLTVADVMTRPALVISPVFGIETAAAILDNRQIRRLPVVRDGQLVGIVSRGDLIKALAATAKPPTVESPASDASQPSTGKRDRPRQRTGEPYVREPKMKRGPLK
jgi:hypothetical protein